MKLSRNLFYQLRVSVPYILYLTEIPRRIEVSFFLLIDIKISLNLHCLLKCHIVPATNITLDTSKIKDKFDK
jgi:hypothetical protein